MIGGFPPRGSKDGRGRAGGWKLEEEDERQQRQQWRLFRTDRTGLTRRVTGEVGGTRYVRSGRR